MELNIWRNYDVTMMHRSTYDLARRGWVDWRTQLDAQCAHCTEHNADGAFSELCGLCIMHYAFAVLCSALGFLQSAPASQCNGAQMLYNDEQ